jgi:hypothetical protein
MLRKDFIPFVEKQSEALVVHARTLAAVLPVLAWMPLSLPFRFFVADKAHSFAFGS